MTRDDLIRGFAELAQSDPRVQALILGGSLGAGTGDAFSDVDLIVVVPEGDHPGFVDQAREWAGRVAEPVLWRSPYPGLPLFVAVTEDWLRFDLTVTVPGRVLGARTRLKPLMDRAGIWDGLPEALPPRPLDRRYVEETAEEALRIMGLFPVAMGREEYVVAVSGIGLMRNQLIALMVAETEPALPPGALHLKRILPPEDMEVLSSLLPMAPERDAVVAANLQMAEVLLARLRRAAERTGAKWPERLEAAARAVWRRDLGLDLPTS